MLAVGDFDGDGFDDLVIGTPNKKVDGHDYAGAVNVIYGTADGLHAERNKMLTQNDSPLIKFGYGTGSRYGGTLAVGDFDGSGRDDLAIGWPTKRVGDVSNAGLIHVIFSATKPLTTYREAVLVQGHGGLTDSPGTNDRFGSALAAGDFDGDGKADLAILVPGETYKGSWFAGAPTRPGAVHVRYGSLLGTPVRDQLFFLHGLYLKPSGTLSPPYDSVVTQPDSGGKLSWPTLADYVVRDYATGDPLLDTTTSRSGLIRDAESVLIREAAPVENDLAPADSYFDQMGQTSPDSVRSSSGLRSSIRPAVRATW